MVEKIKITLISVDYDLTANGIRILSSQLKKYGYNPKIIFLPFFSDKYTSNILAQIYHLVKTEDIIGFSSTALHLKKVIQIIQYLKIQKNFKSKFIWGGIHATLNPEECLKYADFVCVGEGEDAILELLNALKKGKKLTNTQNILGFKNTHLHKLVVRSLINNLNKLPFEDYNIKNHFILVNKKIVKMNENYLRYGSFNLSNEFFSVIKKNFITLHTTRGCPYSCTFCCNYDLKKIYQNKGKYVRKKNVKNIISQLKYLKKSFPLIKFIWFTDDDFFLRSLAELEFFSNKYKKEINLPFMCYATPPTIKEDKLLVLLNAGLSRIEMGIQTGSENFNKTVYNRKISNKLMIAKAKLLNKYKKRMFLPEYQVITSNLFEKEEDIIETLELLKKLPPMFYLRVFNMVLFPGSYTYKKAIELGLLKNSQRGCVDLDYTNHFEHVKIKKKLLSNRLHILLNLMQGYFTTRRCGKIPRHLINFLMKTRKSDFIYKILLGILKFSPYSLGFKKFPYEIKVAYLNIYGFIYRKMVWSWAYIRKITASS